MKILFVEDELSRNIPRVIRLFSKHLGIQRVKLLEELSANPGGAKPEKIKKIVEETNLIEVEYCFPDALRKIIHNINYVLYVIDRNLVESDYEFEDVIRIDPYYSGFEEDDFFQKEGDYLLHKLVYKNVNVNEKFYFLTAHSAKEELKKCEDIKKFINFGQFKEENFIIKSSEDDINRLKHIIDNIDVLNLQIENKVYLDILRNSVGAKAYQEFVHVLIKKDSQNSHEISENLGALRNILENLLTMLGKKLKPPFSYWKNKNELNISRFCWWLTHDDVSKSRQYKFDTNRLIEVLLEGVYDVGSKFGTPHKELSNEAGHQPTADTVNAFVYALKEIILWFGTVMK